MFSKYLRLFVSVEIIVAKKRILFLCNALIPKERGIIMANVRENKIKWCSFSDVFSIAKYKVCTRCKEISHVTSVFDDSCYFGNTI